MRAPSKFRITSRLVRDIDARTFSEFKKRARLDQEELHVGLPGDKFAKEKRTTSNKGEKPAKKKRTKLATIGAAHEFGVQAGSIPGYPWIAIPQRPWLRPGVRSGREDFIRLNRQNIIKVLRGEMTTATALRQLGVMAVGKVQQYIRNGNFTPNAESTIKAKGSSHPLIDTGQMMQSVSFEIAKKENIEH